MLGDDIPRQIGPFRLWPSGASIRVYCDPQLRHAFSGIRGARWSAAYGGWLVPAQHLDLLLERLEKSVVTVSSAPVTSA